MMCKFFIFFLGIIFFKMPFALTIELEREASGFSETEGFSFGDKKLLHYKNKTTWKDNLGNYGTSNCFGTIVSDSDKKIIDYKLFCYFIDQDKDEYTHEYFRDSTFAGGVGKSVLIFGTGKWEKHIGNSCIYAIDYFQEALFIKEKCK